MATSYGTRTGYDFLEGDAPATVNPSLWRMQQLNPRQGLFKVADGIYQVRGFDLANMTLVEGDDRLDRDRPAAHRRRPRAPRWSWLSSTCAQQAGGGGDLHPQPCRPFRRRARRDRRGRRARRARCKIIAPDGFMEHAVAENVIAGNAMTRRAQLHVRRARCRPAAEGQVDAGWARRCARAPSALIAPTDLISRPARADDRRRAHRVPAGAGHRGAGRDECSTSRT